jgi:hypothetical protein
MWCHVVWWMCTRVSEDPTNTHHKLCWGDCRILRNVGWHVADCSVCVCVYVTPSMLTRRPTILLLLTCLFKPVQTRLRNESSLCSSGGNSLHLRRAETNNDPAAIYRRTKSWWNQCVAVEFTVYLLRSVRLSGIFTLRISGSQYRGTVPSTVLILV